MWCFHVFPGLEKSFMRRKMSRWTGCSVRLKVISSKDFSRFPSALLQSSLHVSGALKTTSCFPRRRVKTHVPMLQIWTAEKPHPQEEVSDGWTGDRRFHPTWRSLFHGSFPSFSFDLLLCSVPGLPLGPDSEAEEGPLAGAPHPPALHRL